MADQKISDLNTITGANVDDATDKLPIVDTSADETKGITRGELLSSVSKITTDTAGDSVAIKALRTNNSGTGNPVVIVAGDGDSGDVLVEMRGNTDATLVDTADTKESSDAQFIFYGNGASTFNGPLTLNSNAQINGNIAVTGTVDGRDIATDGSKLDGIEASADVTDTANVTAAIGQGVGTSDSPSFAGLTVDTDTLHVDSTNNRVGIGTSSPGAALDIDTASFLKILVDDGNDVPFSLGASTTGFTIANNTGATTADESITFAQNDGSIRMGTAGSEAMRIASSGSVGIGTTGPSEKLDVNGGNITVSSSNNYPLRVNSTDPGSTVVFSDSGSANAFHQGIGALGDDIRILAGNNVRVFVESSGNVGIGTASPSATLDVVGDSELNGDVRVGGDGHNTNNLRDSQTTTNRTAQVQVNGANGPSSGLSLVGWHSNTGGFYSPQLWLGKSNASDNTVGTNTIVSNGTDLGTINFAGNDGTTFFNAASIRSEVDGTPSAGSSMPGRLVFHTTPSGSTTPTEVVRIDSSGNVGIGTASPTAPLDIATSGYVKLLIDDGANTPFSVGAGANAATIANNTAADDTDEYIRLNANDSTVRLGAGGSEAVRINSAGNVGIGTTTPSEKLDVAGNVTISGSLSKGSGSFKIDHPLKPETHHLVHSFVEAPQADNIYRGRVDLVDGVATVNLDEAGRMTEGTFVLLNGNVQCFTSNESDWCPVRGSVNGNILTIEAQDNTCTDTISWLVIGERIDQHMIDTNWTDENGRIIVEPEKVIMEPEEEVE